MRSRECDDSRGALVESAAREINGNVPSNSVSATTKESSNAAASTVKRRVRSPRVIHYSYEYSILYGYSPTRPPLVGSMDSLDLEVWILDLWLSLDSDLGRNGRIQSTFGRKFEIESRSNNGLTARSNQPRCLKWIQVRTSICSLPKVG